MESLVQRRDETTLSIANPHGVPVTLFANRDVPVELEAVEQALDFVSLQATVDEIWRRERDGGDVFWGDAAGKLNRVVLTPDFHRGAGIPVGTVAEADGFVVPQAVGNDVCCGMRLLVTDVTRDELAGHLDALEAPLRGVFFRGQRDIPMSSRQREALLKEGLWGLHETRQDNENTGIWRHYDPRAQEADLSSVHFQGVLPASGVFAFGDYIAGFGRHRRARLAGQARSAAATTSSSCRWWRRSSTGRPPTRGASTRDASPSWRTPARSASATRSAATSWTAPGRIFPAQMPRPDHGFYVLPTRGPHQALAARYLDAMRNAANFAFGNRLFLGLMAVRVLSEVLGRRVDARLVYDAPHNLIWEQDGGRGPPPPPQGRLPRAGAGRRLRGPVPLHRPPGHHPGLDGRFELPPGRGRQRGLSAQRMPRRRPEPVPGQVAPDGRAAPRRHVRSPPRRHADRSASRRCPPAPRRARPVPRPPQGGGAVRVQGHHAGRADRRGRRASPAAWPGCGRS